LNNQTIKSPDYLVKPVFKKNYINSGTLKNKDVKVLKPIVEINSIIESDSDFESDIDPYNTDEDLFRLFRKVQVSIKRKSHHRHFFVSDRVLIKNG
jgi:hypothetical protein